MLNGDDENATLDYRFDTASSLDLVLRPLSHHVLDDGAPTRFEERKDSARYFFDPEYSSCTKLIADIARTEFPELARRSGRALPLGGRTDSARFESAAQAANRDHPVLKLVRGRALRRRQLLRR